MREREGRNFLSCRKKRESKRDLELKGKVKEVREHMHQTRSIRDHR